MSIIRLFPIILVTHISGINITNGEEVAVKLESVKARHPQLLYESKLYKILQVGYAGTAVQQCCGSGMFIPDPGP
jgi:hypothetical protein